MSEIYEAAREVRDAISTLEYTTSSRGEEVWTELRNVVEVLQGIKAALRDISDVMHAQFYGVKTEEQRSGDDEEQSGDEDGSEAGT